MINLISLIFLSCQTQTDLEIAFNQLTCNDRVYGELEYQSINYQQLCGVYRSISGNNSKVTTVGNRAGGHF